MPEQALAYEGHPLSQMERVVDTFVAPSKTFTDVLRSASWWLPFILGILSALLLATAIQKKVGWDQLVDNQIRANPKAQDQMASAPPEQAAMRRKITKTILQSVLFGSPIVNLISLALISVILWPTINFGFGGSATFGRVFCVGAYAFLPGTIKVILASILLFAGRSPDGFTMEGMVGSNLGYYIDTPGALKTFLTSVDVFTIWTAVLLSIGLAIVARTKRSAGYIAVFGWWLLIILVSTASAAIAS